MKIKAIKVNAFTDSKLGGNPAGVVLDTPKLTDDQMAKISEILDVSETAFLFPSKIADHKVRFFTPTTEIDLCGHATIALFHTLFERGLITSGESFTITQETRSGILPIDFNLESGVLKKVMMTQGKTKILNIYLYISEIAKAIGISADCIDNSLPSQIVSTGLFTLPLCVDSLKSLRNLKPDFEEIKKICIKMNVGSFHIFSFDTIENNSLYHARNFAPTYGINEDPVTGTSNGAVCGYLHKNNIINDTNLICEQGDIIGRPGRVKVEIINDVVKVGGKAVIDKEIMIDI